MANLAMIRPMSTAMQEVADSQDEIGWVEFLHGKVSTKFRLLQKAHCIAAGTRISGDDWMTKFTRQLIDILHSQWIYRNYTLHHYTKGYLRLKRLADIKQEVALLADTQPSDIPRESRYLLELAYKPDNLTSDIDDSYWIAAIKAARKQLLRRERASRRQGARALRTQRNTRRDLLEGVEDTLQRRLRLHKHINKRLGEQICPPAKRQRLNINTSWLTHQDQPTLTTLWGGTQPDIFVFGNQPSHAVSNCVVKKINSGSDGPLPKSVRRTTGQGMVMVHTAKGRYYLDVPSSRIIRGTGTTVPRDHRVVNGRGKDRRKPGRGNNQNVM
jgi:hypothetical protein